MRGAHSSGRGPGPLIVLLGALMLFGCAALVVSPWLPWASNADGDTTININGFNMITPGGDPLGLYQGAGDPLQGGDGGNATVPSLGTIPDIGGGTDASARWGVFVLVLGAEALFMAPWTLAGEIARRRSMARVVLVSGGLALVPLLHDLLGTLRGPNGFGHTTVGSGIAVGMLGSIAAMSGAALLHRLLGREARGAKSRELSLREGSTSRGRSPT